MNPEGGGPTPEEVEQSQPPEAASQTQPTEQVQPPRVPPRPRGFWGRIWRRRPEGDEELDEDIRQVGQDEQQMTEDRAEQRRAERLQNPEEIKTPNTPEELAELLAQMTECQWRERQIRERYGEGRLGRIKAFLAGERDFELTEDGETRRNAWNEITRKALSVGLKIAPGAAAAATIGIFTGGLGLPALGAVFGAAGGRGFVEAWHSLNGGERKIREEIARIQYHQWFRLREMAQSAQEEGIADEQRNERLTQLIDAFGQTNENIAERQQELVGVQKVWNRRRKIGQLIGGVAGLGAGIWAGFAHLSREAMTMDIDGNKVAHLVEKVNGDWHYVYNTNQEIIEAATQGVTITPDAAGYATHALGESTATVVLHAAKNLAGHAAQIGGLLAGLWAGGALARTLGADNEAEREAERARREAMAGLERGFQREQVPPPAGPEPVPQEQLQWQEQFESREKPVPAANDVWVMPGYGIIRINQVDFAGGRATVTALNPDLSVIIDQNGNRVENVQFNLNDILELGSRRDSFENNWRSRFNPDDKFRVRGEMNLVDGGGRPIEPGDYRATVDDERREVTLHRKNEEDRHASFLALAFADLRRVEPKRRAEQQREQQERVVLPRERQIWQIINRDQLPENLRNLDLPERFVIQSTDQDEINVSNIERNATFTIDADDWPVVARLSRRAGMAPAGGGGRGGQRGGGEAGRGR